MTTYFVKSIDRENTCVSLCPSVIMSDFTLGSTEEKKFHDLNKKIVEIKKKIQLSGINDIKICNDIYI